MSRGFSAYHSVLGAALMRRIEDYHALWRAEHDRADGQLYEVMTGERMILAVLVCTYLEALGNFLLALNLDTAAIKKIKGLSLLEKWSEAPNRFILDYQLEKEVLDDLKSLVRRRNDIVHMQPELSLNGKKVHRGNPFMTSGADHAITTRWLTLPLRLADNIQRQSHELGFKFRFYSRVDQLKPIARMFPEALAPRQP